MRRIVYVTHTSRIGGGEVSLLTLLKGLDRTRYDPIVVCYEKGVLIDRLRRMGIQTCLIQRCSSALDIVLVFRLIHLIRTYRVALMHVNSLDIRAGLAGWISGVPVVGHLRVVFPFTWRDRLFVHLCRRVIAVSDAARQALCGGSGSLLRKFVTVYNTVDVSGGRGGDVRGELNLSPDQKLVGSVARIDPCKGLEYFVEAVAQIRPRRPDIRAVVVGQPGDSVEEQEYHDALVETASRLGLDNIVHFLGFRKDVLDIIGSMDVLCVPSVLIHTAGGGIKTEGFGRVIVEAMALGIPVVATRVGGIPEVVVDKETGVLVSPEDPQALAEAMLDLLGDDRRREAMGTAGRKRFEACFSLEEHVRRIEEVYERALSGAISQDRH